MANMVAMGTVQQNVPNDLNEGLPLVQLPANINHAPTPQPSNKYKLYFNKYKLYFLAIFIGVIVLYCVSATTYLLVTGNDCKCDINEASTHSSALPSTMVPAAHPSISTTLPTYSPTSPPSSISPSLSPSATPISPPSTAPSYFVVQFVDNGAGSGTGSLQMLNEWMQNNTNVTIQQIWTEIVYIGGGGIGWNYWYFIAYSIYPDNEYNNGWNVPAGETMLAQWEASSSSSLTQMNDWMQNIENIRVLQVWTQIVHTADDVNKFYYWYFVAYTKQ
eukprot:81068_1